MPHFQSHSKWLLTLIFPGETFPCRFHQTMIFGHHIDELWAVMNQIISWIVIFRLSITTRIISVTCVSNIFCSNQNSRCIWKSMANKSILFVLNANYQVIFFKECGVTGQWIKSIGWQSKTIASSICFLKNCFECP